MLTRVTFSGIDQYTKVQDLKSLYEKYPFVEFVFLYSHHANQKGQGRYPRTVILKSFKKAGVPMALHLCGKIAHDLVHDSNWSVVYKELDGYMGLFDRIQLNIPKTRHFTREMTFPEDKQIIIQLHEGTKELFDCYKHLPNVAGFQDASGGRGIAETEWMLPETEPFGYAGGIHPENVVDVVRELNEICETDFWIDMETGIRTNDKFDVTKCEEICRKLTQNRLINY